MYEVTERGGVLGFTLPRWLTPPRSIRDLASSLTRSIAGSVLKGTTITIPTPMGTQTFDLSNPADRAVLEQMVTGTRITRTPPREPNPIQTGGQFVSEHVPGGWLTIAAVGVGVFLLVASRPGAPRRRRSS